MKPLLDYARTSRHKHRQRGSSLLEVLIAVLVLAIGMLGLAALSAMTIKNSNSAAARSQAVVQVYSLFDTLRLNREQATAGAFDERDWNCETQEPGVSGVFNDWLHDVQRSLGDSQACGFLACGSESCTARIRWDDSRGTGGSSELEIETTSRL